MVYNAPKNISFTSLHVRPRTRGCQQSRRTTRCSLPSSKSFYRRRRSHAFHFLWDLPSPSDLPSPNKAVDALTHPKQSGYIASLGTALPQTDDSISETCNLFHNGLINSYGLMSCSQKSGMWEFPSRFCLALEKSHLHEHYHGSTNAFCLIPYVRITHVPICGFSTRPKNFRAVQGVRKQS